MNDTKLVAFSLSTFFAISAISLLFHVLRMPDGHAAQFVIFGLPSLFVAGQLMQMLSTRSWQDPTIVIAGCLVMSTATMFIYVVSPDIVSVPYSGPASVLVVFFVYLIIFACVRLVYSSDTLRPDD